jgi:PAT family beta-lactamase induction signal transducer AmpG
VLPFLLARAGISVEHIARTISLLSLPWIIHFLWAPLVDSRLPRRIWLAIWALVVGACLAFALPSAQAGNLGSATILGLFWAVAASQVLASCGGLMATLLSPAAQIQAAAWSQPGKLAGSAFSAALFLWLSGRLSPLPLGLVTAGVVAIPAIAIVAFAEPSPKKSAHVRDRIPNICSEVGDLVPKPDKRWSLLLATSPVGTGAALTLLPAIAGAYGVGASGVIWINGIGGGVALALGALGGTLLPDNWNRKVGYAAAGLTNSFAAMTLLITDRQGIYFAGTVLYLFTTGFCWTRFTALITETAGSPNTSLSPLLNPHASTRYSIAAASGNIPLAYMIWLDGLASKHFGIHGMLWVDAGGNLLVVAAVMLTFWLKRKQ